jgi:predicted NBD/HSP70 family sugar kinase
LKLNKIYKKNMLTFVIIYIIICIIIICLISDGKDFMQNIHDIKRQNTFKITDAIRFSEGLTKKEIASETGLSFATVSNICRELKEKNIILENQIERSNLGVGRFPNAVSLNLEEFFGVCIDMHNKGQAILALTNLRNEIVVKKEISLREFNELSDAIDIFNQVCSQACESIGIDKKNLLGVCVAIPGIHDNKTGLVMGSSIGLFEKQPLKRMLEKSFGLPAFVNNESNVASMAVALNNAHRHNKKIENLIYIFCSVGLGVGIIVDGKQLTGCEGHAAEICHIPVGSEKNLCGKCGVRGCVESDLSISGFITKYLDYQPWDKKQIYDYWKEFIIAVENKDSKAMKVMEENGVILGKLTSLLINIFDPEMVYFGGSVSVLFEKMKPIIEEEVACRLSGRSVSRALLLHDDEENMILYGCAEIIYRKINFVRI